MMDRIRRIADGDMEALTALYETYKIPVFRLAFSMTKNRDLAEDITQDTFLRIQEKAGTYRRHTGEAAWIYTIARNLVYDAARKGRREPLGDGGMPLELPSAEGNPESSVFVFLDLIGSLSNQDAEVVSLRILAGLSFKEIGRVMHASAGACSKRYTRALEKLRKEVEL